MHRFVEFSLVTMQETGREEFYLAATWEDAAAQCLARHQEKNRSARLCAGGRIIRDFVTGYLYADCRPTA